MQPNGNVIVDTICSTAELGVIASRPRAMAVLLATNQMEPDLTSISERD